MDKKIKFTLISPYSSLNAYGIRSISTYLRKNGVDVSVLYLPNSFSSLYGEEVLDQVAALCTESDMIGVSVMSNYFVNCAQLTDFLKKKLTVPVVWGGVHATLSPLESLDHCDIAVLGEGEKTMLEILKNFREGKLVHLVPGTNARFQGEIFRNSIRSPLSADELVILDNDFSSDYILVKGKIIPISFSLLQEYMTADYMTLSSFGCPFSCGYCVNNKLKDFYGSQVRFRKTDDIISELALAKEKMPFIRHISFDDDAFIFRSAEEIKDFCLKYKEKIDLPFFVSGFNPMYVTAEKIELLISAGLDRIRMGIQTGSEKGKKIYNRFIPNKKIIESAQVINKFKRKLLLTGYDLILDNPFESKADVVETIRLLAQLPAPFTLNLFSLTYYPGTDIYEAALSAGLIKDKVEDIYKKHYHDIRNSYLNFVVLLFTLFKVPKSILDFLLKEEFIQKDLEVPKPIFKLIVFLGHARRGLNFLLKGDTHTLWRHIRFSLKKT